MPPHLSPNAEADASKQAQQQTAEASAQGPVQTPGKRAGSGRELLQPRFGSTWTTALRLARFAIGVDPRAFFGTVATSLTGSLAEGAGLVLLLPLLAAAGMSFTGTSTASRLGMASQHLLLRAGVPHSLWLPVVLAIFLAVGALRSLVRRSQSMMIYTTTTRAELVLSRRVYESVVKAQWGFLVRQRTGGFTHLLTEELRKVSDAVSLSLSILNIGFLTLLYLAVALKLFPTAMPIVNVDIAMSRDDAIDKARALAASLKLAPPDARAAVQFRSDGSAQNYVELEGGGKDVFVLQGRCTR